MKNDINAIAKKYINNNEYTAFINVNDDMFITDNLKLTDIYKYGIPVKQQNNDVKRYFLVSDAEIDDFIILKTNTSSVDIFHKKIYVENMHEYLSKFW